MDRSQIIAVDFDGTLCFSAWPDVGEPNNPLINYLKRRKQANLMDMPFRTSLGEGGVVVQRSCKS